MAKAVARSKTKKAEKRVPKTPKAKAKMKKVMWQE